MKTLKKYIRPLGIAAVVTLMLAFTINKLRTRYWDSDVSFLINNGAYIWKNRCLPEFNPWTIHDGLRINIQQWLCSVILYLTYNKFSWAGLFVLNFTYSMILMFILWKYTKLFTGNLFYRVLAAVPCYMMLVDRWGSSRPTLVSSIIMMIEFYWLSKYFILKEQKLGDKVKLISIIFILAVLQINYHSAMWVMTLLIIFAFVVPYGSSILKLEFDYKKIPFNLGLIAVNIAGAFVNPNGYKAITYLFKSYSVANECHIMELTPVTLNTITAAFVIGNIMLLVYGVVQRLLPWSIIYLYLGTIILAIQHSRNVWFLIFPCIYAAVVDFRHLEICNKISSNAKVVIYMIGLIIGTLLSITNIVFFKFDEIDNSFYPTKCIEYLDNKYSDNKGLVRMYTDFNNGAAFELNGYKIYIDARPEIYTEDYLSDYNIIREYLDIYEKSDDYDSVRKLIDKYNFTHIVTNPGDRIDLYLHWVENEYTIVVEDENYILWERKDLK